MLRHKLLPLLLLSASLVAVTAGCSAEPAIEQGEQDYTTAADAQDAATLRFTSDFEMELTGKPIVGKGIKVEWSPDRLPSPRGTLAGGRPAWMATGFYQEEGGAPQSFEVVELSADGKSNVSVPGRIVPTKPGELQIWFQVHDRWGSISFDSDNSRNYRVAVAPSKAKTDATARIEFGEGGAPTVTGELQAGGRVTVAYDQDRIATCRNTHNGHAAWGIRGFARLGDQQVASWDTTAAGRPGTGLDRRIDVEHTFDLPESGQLSLWFQNYALENCNAYDSLGGANYTFTVN